MDEISKEVTALLAGSQHFRVRKRRMTLETGVSGWAQGCWSSHMG